VLNVKINLSSIKNEKFTKQLMQELNAIEQKTEKKTKKILDIVNEKM